LLTGTPPIDAPARFNLIEDEQPDPLPPIVGLNPLVSANVAAVVHRAMSINRKHRALSATEMRKALRDAIEDDEHHAAEEEFSRADATRQQREADRRRAEDEAARKAEDERQRQEAETRQLEEARKRADQLRQREAEEAARQAEAERQRQQEVERQGQEEAERQRREAEENEARRLADEESRIFAEVQAARAAVEERQRRATEARQREEERRKAEDLRRRDEEEAVRQAEAERQRQQEAERQRQEDAERQRREDEENEPRRLAENEERIRAEESAKRRARTIPAPPSPTVDSLESPSAQLSGSQPAIETLKVPPKRFVGNVEIVRPSAQSPAAGLSEEARHARSKNITLIVVGALALVFVGAIFIWAMKGTTSQNASSPKPEPTPGQQSSVGQQSNPIDSKPKPPEGMVYVDGGTFTMGRDDVKDVYQKPSHKVTVNAFFIDQYEVSNEDYAKFVKATHHPAPPNWVWYDGINPPSEPLLPVTGVTWKDAIAFTQWRSKQEGGTYRLPTEQEWEFAARGNKDDRRYPWGDEWLPDLANAEHPSGDLATRNSYKGKSPYDVFDMAGNAWEWTASKMAPYPGGTLPAGIKISVNTKVIRGGTYQSNRNQVTTTYRRPYPTPGDDDYSLMGFRCVREIK
jgi:formylglycine-generating enzyme required for sulfatase activity